MLVVAGVLAASMAAAVAGLFSATFVLENGTGLEMGEDEGLGFGTEEPFASSRLVDGGGVVSECRKPSAATRTAHTNRLKTASKYRCRVRYLEMAFNCLPAPAYRGLS